MAQNSTGKQIPDNISGAAGSDSLPHAILLCNGQRHRYIRLNNIVYCHSDNAYITFFMSDGKEIMVSSHIIYNLPSPYYNASINENISASCRKAVTE
jgi:hypothetical protein